MKRFYYAVSFLLSLSCFMLLHITAAAAAIPYFTYSLDKSSASSGEFVKLQINAGQTAETAAGFRIKVDYNAAVLSFVRTETSPQIKGGTMVTNSTGNPICSVYVCNVEQDAAPLLSDNIVSYVFKVNDGALSGKTTIGAHIDEVCDYQGKQLDANTDENLALTIEAREAKPSDEAALAILEPYQGELVPKFSSDVFKYRLYVKNNVESVEFAATAEEGGTVKINRKTLQRAGTDTPIVATVTSADKKVKTQYVILVSREERPTVVSKARPGASDKGEKSSRPAKAPDQKHNDGEDFTDAPAAEGWEQEDFPETYDTAQTQNPAVQAAVQQPAYAGRGDRNIYIIGSQMPSYLTGMLTAALCLMLGIALSFYLRIKPGK